MTNLILVRHGQSEWNRKNLFTGWKDPGLTQQGEEEAHMAAEQIRRAGLTPQIAFTSTLSRAQKTLDIILMDLGLTHIPVTRDGAINERDYGDLTGMDKDEARAKFGEDQVHIWRRSYDIAPPGGESLKDTEARSWPYFQKKILPEVTKGKTVIVSAHGNSLRSIVKNLDGLGPDEIVKMEIATGVPIFYDLDEKGNVREKIVADAA